MATNAGSGPAGPVESVPVQMIEDKLWLRATGVRESLVGFGHRRHRKTGFRSPKAEKVPELRFSRDDINGP